jgi:hypothetical protein
MVRLGYARRTVIDRKTLAVFFVLILISVVIGILNSARAEAQIRKVTIIIVIPVLRAPFHCLNYFLMLKVQ